MREGTEVFTTTDKDRRDRMFEDLRKNGDALEKQVVKFSGVEPVLGSDGQQERTISGVSFPSIFTAINPKLIRLVFRSTWSVAYPKPRGAAL